MDRLSFGAPLGVFLLSLLIATPALAGGVTLRGKVLGTDGQTEVPLESVRVKLTPLGPMKGKKKAPAVDLVGVGITNPTGTFVVSELTSPETGADFPLMKNWTYLVHIQAAAHSLLDAEITVTRKDEVFEFVVISHDYEIVDDTGGVTGEDNRVGQTGVVRRK